MWLDSKFFFFYSHIAIVFTTRLWMNITWFLFPKLFSHCLFILSLEMEFPTDRHYVRKTLKKATIFMIYLYRKALLWHYIKHGKIQNANEYQIMLWLLTIEADHWFYYPILLLSAAHFCSMWKRLSCEGRFQNGGKAHHVHINIRQKLIAMMYLKQSCLWVC